MRAVVVGGAGFIGSHLVDAIAARGGSATVIDDLSVGRREFIAQSLESGAARLVVEKVAADPATVERLARLIEGHDAVFHLAANPEARWGLADTFLDLRQNTLTTWAMLEAMRKSGVERFMLASSGTVYGDLPQALGEDHGPLFPISLYGASKLASEGLVSAFASCFGMKGWIFRFGNVVGPRGTHGAILDFIKKLERDPTRLEVLGDGRQNKPYLHVSDCVAGILFGLESSTQELNCYNLAPPDSTSVKEIAELVVEEMGLGGKARIEYTGGSRGWPGDVPKSRLKPEKLRALGFAVRHTSTDAVRMSIRELVHERRRVL
jgi:UDP-glucose 4-epimerase